MIRGLAVVLSLAVTSAHAGVIYHFSSTAVGPHGTSTTSGKVWTDGEKYRVELDPSETPRQYDIAISHDADQSATHISLSKKTILDRPQHTATRSSLLFHLPAPGAQLRSKPRVRHRIAGKETIVGYETTRHIVEIDYELYDEWDDAPIRGKIHATATLWTTEQLPALPFRRAVQTGFAHVDREIVKVFENIRGMTLRHELKVSRTLEKGPTQTETVSTVVDELSVGEILPAVFEVPRFYQ